jgi:hypothetical protein
MGMPDSVQPSLLMIERFAKMQLIDIKRYHYKDYPLCYQYVNWAIELTNKIGIPKAFHGALPLDSQFEVVIEACKKYLSVGFSSCAISSEYVFVEKELPSNPLNVSLNVKWRVTFE